jgi:MFS family permease
MAARQNDPNVLNNRSFLLLWSAQAISQTAQNVIFFALIVTVEERARSTTGVSLLVLSFIIPAVLVGPIAGALVDRVEKRRMLVATNLLRAIAVLGYLAVGRDWPVASALSATYLLSIAFSTIGQFFAPAEASSIPLLVSRPQLPEANSLFSLTYYVAQVVGFAFLGPLLIKVTTTNGLFVVVSALFFVCSALVSLLPASSRAGIAGPERSVAEGLRRTVGEMQELLQFLAKQQVAGSIMVDTIIDLAVTASVFLVLGTLGVGLVTRVIGLVASDLAYVLSAGGFGLVVGLFLVPRAILRHAGSRTLINAGLVVLGASIFGMAVVSWVANLIFGLLGTEAQAILTLATVMFLALAMGIGSAFVTIPATTLLQEYSPPELRGRVFAALFALSNAFAILPVLFSGALADLIGLREVLALVGVGVLILAAYRVANSRAPGK